MFEVHNFRELTILDNFYRSRVPVTYIIDFVSLLFEV